MKFKAIILLITFSVFATANSYGQKTANYYSGEPGTNSYQGYSFWANGNKPSHITFNYGKDRTEMKPVYAGKITYKNQLGFKLVFPNQKVFYVIPAGYKLKIVNTSLNKTEIFNWEYEGPVNGIGTYCDVCAQDEKDAMKLLRTAYLK